MPPLTATEARLMALLSDRRPHPRKELLACLPDPEYASVAVLVRHVSNLRKKLPAGAAVYAVRGNGPPGYVYVAPAASHV